MKKKVILGTLAGLFLLFLIIIALLPGILSSNLMKPFVLRKANQQMPGEIQVKEWSLGWLGSNVGKDIVYDNRKDALRVRVSEFRTSAGLLSLILGRGELDRQLSVKAHRFSSSARAKIEAAGGTAEVLPLEKVKRLR